MARLYATDLAKIIHQAWADDYPPELEPVNVKGRKAWRKTHLVDLITQKIGDADEAAAFARICEGGSS